VDHGGRALLAEPQLPVRVLPERPYRAWLCATAHTAATAWGGGPTTPMVSQWIS
jgi:hypothetical protein